ncbi:MAG: class I SAM-dependent methyltransferase [Dechloromonas sp.]|nr:MAG: class I SAM-dependent methyltransferase [Dechloromonas sp.]
MSIERLLQHFCPDSHLSILDLGCGKGELVAHLRQQGHEAYGCDIAGSDASNFVPSPQSDGSLRSIQLAPYRLPFEDNQFDCVVSTQVLEHVMDYASTFREIHRVLRPGGISLHVFPSRYTFIEPHVLVPLATLVRNRPWLYFWALLGIRNQFQKGKNAREVTQLNYRYLHAHTNYPTRAEIRKHGRHFSELEFREDVFFIPDPRIQPSLKKRMFVALGGDWLRRRIWGSFVARALYLRK